MGDGAGGDRHTAHGSRLDRRELSKVGRGPISTRSLPQVASSFRSFWLNMHARRGDRPTWPGIEAANQQLTNWPWMKHLKKLLQRKIREGPTEAVLYFLLPSVVILSPTQDGKLQIWHGEGHEGCSYRRSYDILRPSRLSRPDTVRAVLFWEGRVILGTHLGHLLSLALEGRHSWQERVLRQITGGVHALCGEEQRVWICDGAGIPHLTCSRLRDLRSGSLTTTRLQTDPQANWAMVVRHIPYVACRGTHTIYCWAADLTGCRTLTVPNDDVLGDRGIVTILPHTTPSGKALLLVALHRLIQVWDVDAFQDGLPEAGRSVQMLRTFRMGAQARIRAQPAMSYFSGLCQYGENGFFALQVWYNRLDAADKKCVATLVRWEDDTGQRDLDLVVRFHIPTHGAFVFHEGWVTALAWTPTTEVFGPDRGGGLLAIFPSTMEPEEWHRSRAGAGCPIGLALLKKERGRWNYVAGSG